jgi:uncharacterized protein YndB with AHSA1/START domain
MKWITIVLIVIGALAILAAVAAFIGSRLPRSHRATRETVLAAPPEVLWRTLTDVEAFPSWRRDVKRVTRLPDCKGMPMWVEDGKERKLTFAFERMDAPRVLVGRITDRNLPFGGTWTWEITPVPGGTRVQVTEDGEIYNPLFRFMARFIFGYEGTMKGYLSALEAKFHGV